MLPAVVASPDAPSLLIAYRSRPFSLDRELPRLPEGLTLLELAVEAFPDPGTRELVQARIGDWPIEREHWHRVRPKAGHIVHLAVVPCGGQVLRTVLTIALVAAVAYASGGLVPALGGGAFASGVVGASLPIAGVLVTDVAELPP